MADASDSNPESDSNHGRESTHGVDWLIAHDRLRLVEELVAPTIPLLDTEYPNGLRLDLEGPPPVGLTPSGIHPAFFGCYDWHSSVHSHWQLARAIRAVPDGSFVTAAREALDRHLTEENIATEMRWISGRPSFEMPYGMAWVLALCGELRRWGSDAASPWLSALAPLEAHAAAGFERVCKTMTRPIRGGLHNQSAFSLGLVFDWAVDEANPSGGLEQLVIEAAHRFFSSDLDADLAYEPSAADFLSPSLSEADLMRRTLGRADFAEWLGRFVPNGFDRLVPVTVVDPSNGQLAHWAGLNLSRSWMLAAVADALPDDAGADAMFANARNHADAGLPMAGHPDYMISHWVPTFAVYLLTH